MYNAINRFLKQSTYNDNTEILFYFISESEGSVSSSSFIKGLDFGHGRVCSHHPGYSTSYNEKREEG